MAKPTVTHTALLTAGLLTEPDRPLLGWTQGAASVGVYEDEISAAISFDDGNYVIPPRFFVVVSIAEIHVAFECVIERSQLTFRQLVLRVPPGETDLLEGSREWPELLSELREVASGLVAFSVRQTRAGLTVTSVGLDKAGAQGWYDAYRDAVKPHTPQRGKSLGDEHFEKVAEIYRAATLRGRSPTQAVAEALDCPYSTAGRWVWQARRRTDASGKPFLGPAPAPGQPGEINDKGGNDA